MIFYIWHTLLILFFVVFSFILGVKYGKRTKQEQNNDLNY